MESPKLFASEVSPAKGKPKDIKEPTMLMKILLAGGTEGEQEFSSHTELDAYFEEPPQINIQPFEVVESART